MALPDLTGLTNDEVEELVKQVAAERVNRQADRQLVDSATNLITQARNMGFSKTVVKNKLSAIADSVYATP